MFNRIFPALEDRNSTRASRLYRQMILANPDSILAALFLFIALVFNLYQLYPEWTSQAPFLNDSVLHLQALGRTVVALISGQDATDAWLPNIGLGYPLFHYYQHFPYLIPGLGYVLGTLVFHQTLSLADLYRGVNYLLLALFPLSIYWSMRRFSFARLPSALAGLVASLISTNGLYGLEYGSYIWGGYGLYTQLWGMFLLPMALAQGCVTLSQGRGYLWTVLLVAATVLSHVVAGYIALGSLVLFGLITALDKRVHPVPGQSPWNRIGRLILILVLVGLVTYYFVVPFILDSNYLNRSVWELPGKYDSYGYAWVLGTLASGGLFDSGRWPILTLLVLIGSVFSAWHWREERYRIPLILFITWLLLYFGRSTWGAWLDLLPMSRDLQLHRLIIGVQLAGILLAGIGFALPWDWALRRRKPSALLLSLGLTALLLVPVYQERINSMTQEATWLGETQQAYAKEKQDLDGLVQAIRALPPGRVYAGFSGNWGGSYRVGAVPMYAILNSAGLDMVGYLYHALSLNAEVEPLFDDSRWEQYNLFNVRYVVTPVGWKVPSFYQPLGDYGQHRFYLVPTMGYFDLVKSDVDLTGDKTEFYSAASQWLKSDAVRFKQNPTIFLDTAAGQGRQLLPLSQATYWATQVSSAADTAFGNIIQENVQGDVYQANVAVQQASTLMLKVTFHPNWRATVDGVPAETVMLMPSYIGIVVSPGNHTVRLEYQPQPSRRAILGLGLLLLVLIGLVESQGTVLRRPLDRLNLARRMSSFQSALQSASMRWPFISRLAHFVPSRAVPSDGHALIPFKTKLGIYLLFFSIYLLSSAGHFFSTDHIAVYLTTQSLVERHNLAIKPIYDSVKGQDGNYYSNFGIGQALAEIPLYLAGKFVDSISTPAMQRYFGGVNLGDWGGTVPIFFVSLLNQFLTPFTCVLILLFCLRLGFSFRISLLTTLVYGLATAAWVYARDSFQHPLESLLLLLSIYVLFANRSSLRPRVALLAGSLLAFGILTRINLVFCAPIVLLYLFFIIPRRPSGRSDYTSNLRRWLHMVWSRVADPTVREYLYLFCLPVFLALALLIYLNTLRYGQPLDFHVQGEAIGLSTPIWLGLYGNLFSLGRSIFLYSPPVLLALFTFAPFYRAHRAEAILFLALIGVYLVLYSTYGYWDGGWAWGPRFLLAIVPLLILPLGYFLTNRRNVLLAGILAVLGAGVQILGVVVNYSYIFWDWRNMNLSPSDAYLFVPEISAIPTHLRALLAGRNIDLWFLEVLREFGPPVFVLTLAIPLAILVYALRLVRAKQPTPPAYTAGPDDVPPESLRQELALAR